MDCFRNVFCSDSDWDYTPHSLLPPHDNSLHCGILLGIALTYVGIQRAQGAPIHYKMIKEVMTFRIFFCTVGYYLLQLVVLIPAILLIVCGSALLAYGQQHTPSTSLNLFAFILYFAAAILLLFLIVRMWLGLGFIVDKKQNPWEALKSTFAATTGNVWNLLGLAILVCLILAASIITLYIGMIWGMPWIVIIYGEVYKRLGLRT